ncbi:MAG: hypothetical protein IJ013_07975 [Bacteroidaceae bacterium]|nr:hypothetical protein [Bacteroidaceae bacterium]
MKKIILIACAMCFTLDSVIAQVAANGNSESNTTVSEQQTEYRGSDIVVNYDSDYKIVKTGIGADVGKIGYLKWDWDLGFGDDVAGGAMSLGLGLRKRHIINNSFLIHGMIYPYLGYTNWKIFDYDEGFKFGYGASANLSIGIRLWKSNFITVGYHISAPKFKTENMFDNGFWGIGLTFL